MLPGINAPLGATVVADTSPYVYVLGSDGHLWINWWNDDSDQFLWNDLGTPTEPTKITQSVMGAMTIDGDRPAVFMFGDDGHLWLNIWTGSQFLWADQHLQPQPAAGGR